MLLLAVEQGKVEHAAVFMELRNIKHECIACCKWCTHPGRHIALPRKSLCWVWSAYVDITNIAYAMHTFGTYVRTSHLWDCSFGQMNFSTGIFTDCMRRESYCSQVPVNPEAVHLWRLQATDLFNSKSVANLFNIHWKSLVDFGKVEWWKDSAFIV